MTATEQEMMMLDIDGVLARHGASVVYQKNKEKFMEIGKEYR